MLTFGSFLISLISLVGAIVKNDRKKPLNFGQSSGFFDNFYATVLNSSTLEAY